MHYLLSGSGIQRKVIFPFPLVREFLEMRISQQECLVRLIVRFKKKLGIIPVSLSIRSKITSENSWEKGGCGPALDHQRQETIDPVQVC
jgi:hypothetical protein